MSNFKWPLIQYPHNGISSLIDPQIVSNNLQEKIFIIAHQMNHNVPFHMHNFYEIIYVINVTVINQIYHKSIYLMPNSIFVMNLESKHALKIKDEQAIVFNICLKADLFKEGIFKEFLNENSPISNFLREYKSKPYLYFPFVKRNIIRYLLNEYEQNNFKMDYSVAALVLLLLDKLNQETNYSYFGITDHCLKIIQYIEKHYANISVTKLANHFDYTPSYLSRYVKKYTGITIKQLITSARLDAAKKLLKESDYTIEQISLLVGYQSSSYFYKLFEKTFNMTPTEFRE